MNPMTIADWPGTPGSSRLAAAQKAIEEDANREKPLITPETEHLNQTLEDAKMLLRQMDILDFTWWAQEQLENLYNAEQINNPLDLAEIAVQEAGEDFIPLIITISAGEDTGEEATASITKLNRHHEWIGLHPQLPYLEGLELHAIYTADDPESPFMIVATNDWTDDSDNPPVTAPDNVTSKAIEEIAQWHGAVGCFWHTAQPAASLQETTA